MKRVKAACICQTLHFMLKEDVGHDMAVKLVNEEVAHYKANMDRNRTKYKILEETPAAFISRQSFRCCRPHSKHSFLPTGFPGR